MTEERVRAPSVSTLWGVIQKTVLRNWRDLRFLVSVVVVLGTSLAGGLSSGAAIEEQAATARAATMAARIQSDLERAVFVRRPNPWTFVQEGGTRKLPDHLVVLPGFVDYPRRHLSQPGPTTSQRLDWSFIVVYLLSLAAIFVSFDVVSSEREAGTFELVFAQPVTRSRVLAGLAVGSAVGFLPLVIAGFLLNVAAVALVSPMARGALIPSVLLAVLGLSCLLVACMILISCLASAVAGSSVNSGLLALLVWIAAAILIPEGATLFAKAAHPTPSFRELEVELDSARKRFLAGIRLFSSMEIREIVDRRDLDPEQKRAALHALQAEISEQHEEGLRTFKEEALEVRRRYLASLGRQVELAENLSRVSPVGMFTAATEALVGTGRAHHHHFLRAAERFMGSYSRIVETQRRATEPRIYGPVITESGVKLHAVLWQSWRGIELAESVPLRFQEEQLKVPAAPREALHDAGLLALTSLLLAAMAFAVFR